MPSRFDSVACRGCGRIHAAESGWTPEQAREGGDTGCTPAIHRRGAASLGVGVAPRPPRRAIIRPQSFPKWRVVSSRPGPAALHPPCSSRLHHRCVRRLPVLQGRDNALSVSRVAVKCKEKLNRLQGIGNGIGMRPRSPGSRVRSLGALFGVAQGLRLRGIRVRPRGTPGIKHSGERTLEPGGPPSLLEPSAPPHRITPQSGRLESVSPSG